MSSDTERVDRPGRCLRYGCGDRRCDECYMTVVKLPRPKRVRKPKVVKAPPVITQETIDTILNLNQGVDLVELLGGKPDVTILNVHVEPEKTVYAKDTQTPERVYVDTQTDVSKQK